MRDWRRFLGVADLAGLFVGLALISQLISVVENYVAQDVGLTATNRLRADLVRHCLRLDPSFHSTHTPGRADRATGRRRGDARQLLLAAGHQPARQRSVADRGVLILVFGVDWRAGATLGGVCRRCDCWLLNALRDVGVPYWVASRQSSADLYGFLEERLAGTEDIRANGATAYMMRPSARVDAGAGPTGCGPSRWAQPRTPAPSLCCWSGSPWHWGLAATCTSSGRSPSAASSCCSATPRCSTGRVQQITRQMQDLQQAIASLGRVRDLLGEQSAVLDPVGPAPGVAHRAPCVELDTVSFRYRPDEPVLENVSLRLEPGQVLGLLGRTGSGKTTMTRLLFRLYDPPAPAASGCPAWTCAKSAWPTCATASGW